VSGGKRCSRSAITSRSAQVAAGRDRRSTDPGDVSRSAGSATRPCDSRRDPGCQRRRFSRPWGGRDPAAGAGSRRSTVAKSLCRLATVRAGRPTGEGQGGHRARGSARDRHGRNGRPNSAASKSHARTARPSARPAATRTRARFSAETRRHDSFGGRGQFGRNEQSTLKEHRGTPQTPRGACVRVPPSSAESNRALPWLPPRDLVRPPNQRVLACRFRVAWPAA
jgi:hypothetical protein